MPTTLPEAPQATGEASDAPDPVALAPFDLLRNRLPEKLHPDVEAMLRATRRELLEACPAHVKAVVAYYNGGWSKKAREVTLYTLAASEEAFLGTDSIHHPVGEVLRQSEVIPVVEAMQPREWKKAVEEHERPFRDVSNQGIVIYEG